MSIRYGRDFEQSPDIGRLNLDLRGYPDGRRSKSPRSPIGLAELRGHGSGESMTLEGSRSSLEGSRIRAQVHPRQLDTGGKLSKEAHQKTPPKKEADDSESDIDVIVKQMKENKQLDVEKVSTGVDPTKDVTRPIIQFKTIGQLAMLRAPKKLNVLTSQKDEKGKVTPPKEPSPKPTESSISNKYPKEQVSTDKKERVVVIPANGQRGNAIAYADLWQLRATLESKDSSEASESSEYETVIACRNVEEIQGLEKVSPSRTESFDVTDEDSSKFISTSFEQTISSVSAEESDTSERDRNSAESGKESIRSLKQMQGDSGYASIEQKAEMLSERLDWKRRQQFAAASDHDSTSFESAHSHSMTISSDSSSPTTDKAMQEMIHSNASHHDNKSTNKASWVRGGRRTASTKRREFTSEKKEAIFDSFSFAEEEAENQDTTDSSKDAMTRASSTETYQFDARPKFRERVRRGGPGGMQRREPRLSCYPKGRDFSIDEKTDALFKQFLRQDAMFDTPTLRRSKPYNRQRWQPPSKQHSDSVLECSEKEPVIWRAEDHRSSSLDQRGGNGETAKQRLTELLPRSQSRGRLMPSDSVEEDYLRNESRQSENMKRPPRLREIQGKVNQTTTTADVHALTAPQRDLRRADTEKTERELLRLDDVSSRPSAFRPVKKTLPQRSATVDSLRDNHPRLEEFQNILGEKKSQYMDDLQRRRDRSPIVPPKILVGRCKTPEKQASPNPQRSKSASPRSVSPYRDDREKRDESPGGRSPKRSYSPRRFDLPNELMEPKPPPFRRGSQPSQSPPIGRQIEEGGHVSRRDRSASMQETGLLQVPRSRSGSRSQGASPRPRHRKRDIPDDMCPEFELENVPFRKNRSLEILERTRHELEKERPYRDHPVTPLMKRELPLDVRRSPRMMDYEFEERRRREREREKGIDRPPISPGLLKIDRDSFQRLSPQGREYDDPRTGRDMDRNRDFLQRPRSREPSRSPIRHRERFVNEGRAGSETALLERRARGENGRRIPRYPLRAQSTGDVLSDERRRNASKNW